MWLIKTDSNGNTCDYGSSGECVNESAGTWVRKYGESSGNDIGNDVIQTTDGGYVITGSTRSYSSDGYRDAWVIKVDGLASGKGVFLPSNISEAKAILDNRTTPDITDVQDMIKPVLRHRIISNFNAETEGISKDSILDQLINLL